MIKCCGRDRSTPFCPRCGKRLSTKGDDPLLDLLAHCQLQAKTFASKAEVDLRRSSHEVYGEDRRKRFLARSQSNLMSAARWENWAKVLAAKIGGENVAE